jgi:Ca2+-binding RTX toxin-like protein
MRRPAMVLIFVAVMVALLAGVAYAATIEGTNRDDILRESQRNDQMYGFDGEDDLLADFDSSDTDVLRGGRGPDYLTAVDQDGRDTLYGGKGNDDCYIDPGDPDPSGCELTVVILPD